MAGRSCTIIRRATEAFALALALAIAASAASALVVAGCAKRPPTGVALIGVTVLDGSGAPARDGMVVVVRGPHIEAIVPAAGFETPPRTTEVDLSGKWVIPGLIDAHAHAARWALPRYLGYGVTTIRDAHGALDSILALREQANLNAIPSPRIYSAGAMIDARPATYPDAIAVDDGPEARKGVDHLAVAGADFVKTYTRVTPPILRATIDEAKTFNLPVAGHLGLTDALTAADAGIRSIEHLSGVPEAASADPAPFYAAHRSSFFAGWTAFERGWAALDSAALARVAQQLAAKHVVLVPTLVLHETFSRLDDSATYRDSTLLAVPDSEVARWNTPDLIRRAGWTAADFAAFRRARPAQDRFLRDFRRAGGLVAAGTDASNQMLVPGASEHAELRLLVAAGLTPADAIAAATANAARLLGADSIGVLAPGKVADLVVLDASPLADIRNTTRIARVMQRGRLMRADSLRRTWKR